MHMSWSLAFPWDRTLGQPGGIGKRSNAKLTILSKGLWGKLINRQSPLVKGFSMKKKKPSYQTGTTRGDF